MGGKSVVLTCFMDQTCHHRFLRFAAHRRAVVHSSHSCRTAISSLPCVAKVCVHSLMHRRRPVAAQRLGATGYRFSEPDVQSGEAISLGQAELRARLSLYQEEVHETEPTLLTGPPERYLTQWADAGWLQRFLESASVEPQFQLTRYAEEAIRFVDSAVSRGNSLVGTESRLRLVIETLEDIVRGASADPDRRLEYLRAQRAASTLRSPPSNRERACRHIGLRRFASAFRRRSIC